MNVPFELMGFSMPFNPEICWNLSVALLHTTWQIVLLWLTASSYARQKKASPHNRFRVSFTCLLIAGALPLLNYFWLTNQPLPTTVSVAVTEFDSTGSVQLFRPSELAATGESSPNLRSMETAAAVRQSPTATNASSPISAGNWKVSASAVTTMIYLLGVTGMLLRLGNSVRHQQKLRRVSAFSFISKTSHPILWAAAVAAAKSYSRALRTRIATFEGSGTALVVGIFRPVILVNATLLTGLTPEQVQQIFAHELAHVYRMDTITLFVQRVIESILFFHPGVWLLSRHVTELRELCCDDAAANASSHVTYADTLLRCYEIQLAQPQGTESLALPIMGRHSNELISRIEALLSDERPFPPGTSVSPTLKVRTRLLFSFAFVAIALTTLSSRSTAGFSADTRDSADVKVAGNFQWVPVEDIGDSAIESPRLWMSGVRLDPSGTIPSDIAIEPMLDPSDCLFAQWHFGDSLSKRVSVLVEVLENEPQRVFVDLNRDRTFQVDEELNVRIHSGKVWIADLQAMVGSGDEGIVASRQIAIYPRKDRIRVRTLGHAEGRLKIGDDEFFARRIDRDGTGVPVESGDRLWIDLDSDGSYDPVLERFTLADRLEIKGVQYTLRSDRIGHEVTLSRQDELGHLRFELKLADESASLEKLEGTLRDEHGMLIAVRLSDAPLAVPPGKYCLEHLVLQVRDESGTTWRMNLARSMDIGWIDIEPESSQTISLLNDFQFAGTPVQELEEFTGYHSHVQATVYTSNGLAITDLVQLKPNEKQNNMVVDRLVSMKAADSSIPAGLACSGFN